MDPVILGGITHAEWIWNCDDCSARLKNKDFGALEMRAHVHRLQQHGPIGGQEAFGFEIPRRKAEDNT